MGFSICEVVYCLSLIPLDRPSTLSFHAHYVRHLDAVKEYQSLNVQAQLSKEHKICRLHHNDSLILEVVLPLLEGTDQSFIGDSSAVSSPSTHLGAQTSLSSRTRATTPSGGSDSMLICRDRLCTRLYRSGVNTDRRFSSR